MSLNSIVHFFDIDGRDEECPTSQIVARHSTYYFPGGDLFITVQRVLFQIHSHFLLRESTHFLRLLTPSPHDLPVTIGTSAIRPLILTDITPSNFAIFLWVFYNPRFGQYETTHQNWIIIHNYSLIWNFPEVRHLAEHHLLLLGGSNCTDDKDGWISTDSVVEEFIQIQLQDAPLEDELD